MYNLCVDVDLCNGSAYEVCKFDASKPGKHECVCIDGYVMDPSTSTCIDEDECKRENPPCPANSQCKNLPGTYACVCNNGYAKDTEGNCNDIDECAEVCEGAPLLHQCSLNVENCVNAPGSYVCVCKDGYERGESGTCINTNECLKGTAECPVYSVCEDLVPGYDCNCYLGTKTKRDETIPRNVACDPIDECSAPTSPCHVSANCTNTLRAYECSCPVGFIGDPSITAEGCFMFGQCSQCPEHSTCLSNSVAVYNCTCDAGYEMVDQVCKDIPECSRELDNCHPTFATCKEESPFFSCECNIPYEGDGSYCERIWYCERGDHDCPSGSTCSDLQTVNSYDNYFTCLCPPGRRFNETSRACDDINECKLPRSPCADPPLQDCINTFGSFNCICYEGYKFSDMRQQCEDIDECFNPPSQMCSGHGDCENEVPGYSCNCYKGFSASADEKQCIDDNECALNPNICGQPEVANCTNLVGSYKCICQVGYVNQGLQKCVDLDECKLNRDDCHDDADCTNTVGSYTCACREDYEGDGFMCSPVTCDVRTCGTNAHCIEKQSSAGETFSFCVCDTGYQGDPEVSCSDINECLQVPNPCSEHSQCQNVPGNYTCFCDEGFQKINNFCENINECLTDPCGTRATCTDTIGSYTCACPPGTTGDALVYCNDINECESTEGVNRHFCHANADCTNRDIVEDKVRYECDCRKGYQGDGFDCTDCNECKYECSNQNYTECDINSQCYNSPGNYSCDCNVGFKQTGLYTCEDINECLNNKTCDENANCTNNIGSYRCRCYAGFDDRTIHNVQHSTIQTKGTGLPNQCKDFPECKNAFTHQCSPASSTCFEKFGDYSCTCKAGYRQDPGNDKQCDDINECEEETDTCGEHTCQNLPGDYQCLCKIGFKLDVSKHTCIEINECASTSPPCHPKANCTNTIGSYECKCMEGFEGDGIDCVEIDFCNVTGTVQTKLNDCDEDTTVCTRQINSGRFSCLCKDGYKTILNSRTTCENINECITATHTCSDTLPHSACRDKTPHLDTKGRARKWRCQCNFGFKYNRVEKTCDDIDECAADTECVIQAGRECKNLIGSFSCLCMNGYLTVGSVCQNIDECEENSHDCTGNYECQDDSPLWTCKCPVANSKEVVRSSGKTECIDANKCYTDEDCSNIEHTKCVKGQCVAEPGWFLASQQIGGIWSWLVQDVDECTNENSSPVCSMTVHTANGTHIQCNSQCVNTLGSYFCSCNADQGYQEVYSFNTKVCQCGVTCETEKICPWYTECTQTSDIGIDCGCKFDDYATAHADDTKAICSLGENTFDNKYHFVNHLCNSNMECEIPNEDNFNAGRMEASPFFNYWDDNNCGSPVLQTSDFPCKDEYGAKFNKMDILNGTPLECRYCEPGLLNISKNVESTCAATKSTLNGMCNIQPNYVPVSRFFENPYLYFAVEDDY